MILRIIFCVIVILLIAVFKEIVLPMWRMMDGADSVFIIYENMFDIYPEERQQLFPEDVPGQFTCGKIQIKYQEIKEACFEFEKCIDDLLDYYKKYNWIVEQTSGLQYNKEQLAQIKTKVSWLRNR